jgi:hypothetical protein
VRHEAMFCIQCLHVKELAENVDWHSGVAKGSSLRVDWYVPMFRYIAVPSSAGSSTRSWTVHTQREAPLDVSSSWSAVHVGQKTIKRSKPVYTAAYKYKSLILFVKVIVLTATNLNKCLHKLINAINYSLTQLLLNTL